MGLLSGKTAIVTGSAGGIGLAIAERFHGEGAAVVLCDVKADKLPEAAAKVSPSGERVHAVPADVTVGGDVQRVVREAAQRFGAIHVLVNNAARLHFGRLEDAEPAAWDRMLRTNTLAPWRFMVAVLPAMRRAGGGAIVNVSSINGIKAFPGAGLYCTSKAALQMLSQVMAMEVAADHIRVNLILPGTVEDTDFCTPMVGRENLVRFYETLRPLHPLGRSATPADVADAALFLASDLSRHVTGVLLNVDGGRHLATNRPTSGEE